MAGQQLDWVLGQLHELPLTFHDDLRDFDMLPKPVTSNILEDDCMIGWDLGQSDATIPGTVFSSTQETSIDGSKRLN